MSVDPYWDCVASALHMDGTNGGTTFTDQKSNSTITAGGSVTTVTASPKFGTANGDFPGGASDKLTVSNYWDYDFGSADFTIEGWFKENNVTKQYMTMLSRDSTTFPTHTGSFYLYINHTGSSTGDVAFVVRDYHATNPILASSGSGYDDNVWHHVAVTRQGNMWMLFVDGAVQARRSDSTVIGQFAQAVLLGNSDETASREWNGGLDDWRVSLGVCRYTMAFTAPTAAFADSAYGTRIGATGATGAAGANIPGPPGPPGESSGSSLTPITLPPAPRYYDVADQRQVRRIIEAATV